MTTSSLASLSLALADPGDWGHMGGWGWGMAVFGTLFMAAVLGLIVWLAVWSTRRTDPPSRATRSALDLLDERYARGEIDRDDYLERRADLQR